MGEWLDLDLVLFHPSLLTGLFTGNAETDGAGASLRCVSSGDGSAFAFCDGQVLLDIQGPDSLGDSE